jgi:cysteine desulfurase
VEAYLDNSATTRCYDEVRDVVVKTMMEDYGNPSSMHQKGVEGEKYIKEAAARIAKTMKVEEKEIYFTSGGTEADNWALIGTALANQRAGKHIITTAVEHPAVSAPLDFLESHGFEVTRLGVDSHGEISLEELKNAIRPDTILVSAMYVNNEVGTVLPISQMGEIIKKQNPGTYFHVDAIQAYGKYRILPRKMKIDMLSASGHKIHGPKGIGFLYVNEKVKIVPYIYGGGQQRGMRSGTDNVPGAAGLGVAAEKIYRNLDENAAHMRELRDYFTEELNKMDQVYIHGASGEEAAYHIVSVSFAGVRSEVLLHTLEEHQIYVSAGSACSTHKRSQSPTLTAMGTAKAQMESTVRFSFCETTTREELEYTLGVLQQAVPMLRKYARH